MHKVKLPKKEYLLIFILIILITSGGYYGYSALFGRNYNNPDYKSYAKFHQHCSEFFDRPAKTKQQLYDNWELGKPVSC